MAYVKRDAQGKIIEVFDTLREDAREELSVNSEELLDFLRMTDKAHHARMVLSDSDMALVRVLEDLINTLIEKQVIMFTDLPLAAREKLANREKIRGQLSSLENLMDDDPGIL